MDGDGNDDVAMCMQLGTFGSMRVVFCQKELHLMTPYNTLRWRGAKYCRECRYTRNMRSWYKRQLDRFWEKTA